jgi:hypothetical protein
VTVSGYAILYFLENAKGGNAMATCFGGMYDGNNTSFADNATAEEDTYTVVGASAAGEFGSFIEFLGDATADLPLWSSTVAWAQAWRVRV